MAPCRSPSAADFREVENEMLPLAGLHALAARHGDGLRQEFLELFAKHEALDAANVEELAAHCVEHFSQAGPNLIGEVGIALPEGVLPFRKTEPNHCRSDEIEQADFAAQHLKGLPCTSP